MSYILNKNIIITGASRGIGKSIALHLAAHKSNLGIIARSEEELGILKQEIINLGSKAEVYAGSVSDSSFIKETVAHFINKFGCIDVLINNAGYGTFKPAEDFTETEWDELFATNTKGTFLMCKEAIPCMKRNRSGHIVNIASDVAKRTFGGGSLYCASKYAQDAFSQAIRKELRPYDIKVSVVYSGLVDSTFHGDPQGHQSHDNWLKNEDMANAILYIVNQPQHVVIDELMIHPLSQEY